jgi:hypothetical protein
MSRKEIYKVIFHNQGKIYEIYARKVQQGKLPGFIEVEEMLFGERSKLLVDPTEEKLQSEFEGVETCFIPMHAIVRIDKVSKEGTNKIIGESEGGNVMAFPGPAFTPDKSSD